ncbi:MAG: hypothetical protein KDA99_14315, partial [Planctomycetales bacterium]|nr:hypothetical protein [Planctomycetales bacterium]
SLMWSNLAAAQGVANASFEDPITADGAPFVGFWEAFSAGAGAISANSTEMPRTGAQSLLLEIDNVDNSFAGAFQDIPNLTPGTSVTYSLWHKSTSNPLDLGTEVRIEWRDSVGNVEISRTANSTPVPSSDYTEFSLSSVVPAGADTARIVYAIQTFGPEPTNSGSVYIDDVSFVPEPSAGIMSLVALLAMPMLRRRSR